MGNFHISKRKTLAWYTAWAIRGCAILLALLVCAVVTTALTGEDPIAVYKTMFSGAFGTPRKLWTLGQNIAILLCVSLAVTPAFKMRFWNVGGEGQILIGGLATAACMILLGGKLPNWLLILIMLLCACGAGALWGMIPAIFKAKWNTNETLFTLMMNYVATQLVAYFVIVWEVPKGAGKIGIINQTTESGWLPQVGPSKYFLNILVVAVLTVLMYLYLSRSKRGGRKRAHRPVCGHQGQPGHRPDHGHFRCLVRPCGIAAGRRHGPHHHHDHCRRPGLHRRHGGLAGQVQPSFHGVHLVPSGVPGPGRQ